MHNRVRGNFQHGGYTWHRVRVCHSSKRVWTADFEVQRDVGFSRLPLVARGFLNTPPTPGVAVGICPRNSKTQGF